MPEPHELHSASDRTRCDRHDLHAEVTDMVSQLEQQIALTPDQVHVARREISDLELLDWLSSQSLDRAVYWKSRDGNTEAAALGVCRELKILDEEDTASFLDRVQTELQSIPNWNARMYGGVSFDHRTGPQDVWSEFGQGLFILPLLEVRRECNVQTLILQSDSASLQKLKKLSENLAPLAELDDGIPPPVSRHDFPHQDEWRRRVLKALSAFDAGDLQKIVLARKALYRFDDELNMFVLLHRLQAQTPNCFHFLFKAKDGVGFIGASPERLYKRTGMDGQSEAVAGTRPRGATEKIDRREGEKLLESEKDQREHEFVRESIQRTLESLSDSVRLDTRARLLKLSRGQHLYSGFDMQLRPGVTDATLVSNLHPTPAVGGEPREAAVQFLREWEEFNRGWYAAPVGWMEKDAAEFAVAIRSGLVDGNTLSLFSGAGIVKGSDPDSEWSEIENKISDFIHILTQR